LDGSEHEVLFENINVYGIEVNSKEGKLYWGLYSSELGPRIQRSNLDGTIVEDVVIGAFAKDIVIPQN